MDCGFRTGTGILPVSLRIKLNRNQSYPNVTCDLDFCRPSAGGHTERLQAGCLRRKVSKPNGAGMTRVLPLQRFVAREQELLQARGSRPPDTERALQAHERHKILGPADCVQSADFI